MQNRWEELVGFMGVLNSSQVETYHRDGVLFPLPALSNEELDYFRSKLQELLNSHGGRLPARQMRHLHHFYPWAYELAVNPVVMEYARTILGADILLHSTTMFCKIPGDGTFVSWHQDGFYWRLQDPSVVSAWIALYDSTAANGCMRVIPGSHRGGDVPHKNSAISEWNLLSNGMEVERKVREEDAADVLLRAGEASLHHVNVIHGSNPNLSDSPRVGFAVRYISPATSQDGPCPPLILVSGENKHGNYQATLGPPVFPPSDQVKDSHNRLLEQMVEAYREPAK